MSISASQIVNVVPGVISAGGTDLEITGLLLTKILYVRFLMC